MAPSHTRTNEELQAQIDALQNAIDNAKRQPKSPYRRSPAPQRFQAPYPYPSGGHPHPGSKRHHNLTLINKTIPIPAVNTPSHVKSKALEGQNIGDGAATQATPQAARLGAIKHILEIHGLRFRVSDDGSKLFRMRGTCSFGPDCRFGHDPNKVAVCRTFLLTGECADGENCNLSHIPSYHNAPACAHFLRGNCTNDACRYPHIHVPANAPVCRAFAVGGYCPKGPECDRRHANECPDFTNKGACPDRESGKCRLPHIEHAKVMRRKEAREKKAAAGEELTDVSSDEEMIDDVDSDVPEEDVTAFVERHDGENELAQQSDYVALG